MSASRHVQDLELMVDVDAPRPASPPVVRPRRPVAYREPTFDELVRGWDAQPSPVDPSRRVRGGWFRAGRAARAAGTARAARAGTPAARAAR